MEKNRLSEHDFQILRAFAEKGDRYNYWQYLSKFDDGYANLALGVVTNETLPGCIANLHTDYSARYAGIKLTAEDKWRLGEEIMRGDLQARELRRAGGVEDGGVHLPVREIANYHQEALKKFGLGLDAWTANQPLKQYLDEGKDEAAERVWSGMKSGGFLDTMRLAMNNISNPTWVIGTAHKAASCLTTPSSARHLDKIDGTTRDVSTGNWWYNPGSGVPGDEFIFPMPVKDSQEIRNLNAERERRQRVFGENALTLGKNALREGEELRENKAIPQLYLEQNTSRFLPETERMEEVDPFTPLDNPQTYPNRLDPKKAPQRFIPLEDDSYFLPYNFSSIIERQPPYQR